MLVVDDETPARNELAFLLRQLPQIEVVAEAADADECLAHLDQATFDAVLLDVRMPRLDGLALARVVKLGWAGGADVGVGVAADRWYGSLVTETW